MEGDMAELEKRLKGREGSHVVVLLVAAMVLHPTAYRKFEGWERGQKTIDGTNLHRTTLITTGNVIFI